MVSPGVTSAWKTALLRARVRLHVDIGRAEQLLGESMARFRDIDEFTAAVVALAGIAFGVFVGQLAALCFEYAGAGVVFGSNQFDVGFLACHFFLHGIKQRIIESGNCHVAAEHRREPRYERIIMEKRGGYHTAARRDFHRIRVWWYDMLMLPAGSKPDRPDNHTTVAQQMASRWGHITWESISSREEL